MSDKLLRALIRANKLGAQGIRVVSFAEPITASQPDEYILITSWPNSFTASELNWWDK